MPDEITISIDHQQLIVPTGTTLLVAAQAAGISIPTICYHPATTSNALCRLCVVEVEGSRLLQPACIVEAGQGMVVHTRSERVDRARRTILEMLAASVELSDSPEIMAYMEEYAASAQRFPEARQREMPILDDNPMYIRDYSRCVLCWRCVQVCAEDAQYTYAINFSGRGHETQIGTFFDKPIPNTTCVLCGQCVGVCPTGALKPKREWQLEMGLSPEEITSTAFIHRAKRRRPAGTDAEQT